VPQHNIGALAVVVSPWFNSVSSFIRVSLFLFSWSQIYLSSKFYLLHSYLVVLRKSKGHVYRTDARQDSINVEVLELLVFLFIVS
jgi:hypothetical protein